jgi:hypothetical protein
MASGNGTKMYTVDKFLGINESGDGDTELKMGEASKMENFFVTDAFNLTLRPGVRRIDFAQQRTPAPILGVWAGFVRTRELFVMCDFLDGKDRLFVYDNDDNMLCRQEGILSLTSAEDAMVSIFTFNGKLYVMSSGKTAIFTDENTFVEELPYVPLVVAGADPQGGGTPLENLNMLTGLRRINYSADGQATDYVLPEEALAVTAVVIDNASQNLAEAGSFDSNTHTYKFNTAPVKGVGNVEITYDTDPEEAAVNRREILSCPLREEYNGSTDTRLFVAGNGSNRCYYTGVTQDGNATAMYFPALNEVAVDMSGSSITGLMRHYSKLLVFKSDGTSTISYEPVTMEDGRTIAGFYLRPMNREFGNEVMGQIQTVDNYPRTITKDGIYEWRITSSYYKDERYAKRISDFVQQTLQDADINKIVTCDDGYQKTYYAFLNDEEGTVLVNRYSLTKDGIWCIYKGSLFRNVRYALMMGGKMVFVNDTEAFFLDKQLTRDAALVAGGNAQQIKAVWESGFMHFGADFKRKYSSTIYLSVKPQSNSEVIVTAETDKRSDYMEKVVYNNVAYWPNLNFVDWTFNTNDKPTINRVRLKVKKFVYYKLIFRIERDGAQGTILGFDQQIRFASMAK